MSKRKLVAFGGYDASKPRVRLLLDALRRRDALAGEISIAVWDGVEDKSVAGKSSALCAALKLLLGMPRALIDLIRSGDSSDVLLPYPGTPDIFAAALVAKLQGRKVVLDAFLPIHDTIVGDRAMVKAGGIVSGAIRLYERLGFKLADIILTDTDAHADYFASEFSIDRKTFETVLVGAEDLFAPVSSPAPIDDLLAIEPPIAPDAKTVLFYGQLIPLHGMPTILAASQIEPDDDVQWIIVGKGQLQSELEQFLHSNKADNVSWIPWVDYERLPDLIARADICLGVFGGSDKAARVIPNKLFQQLAMGKPVITRSSPAVDQLAQRYPAAIRTVPPDNAQALAAAVESALSDGDGLSGLPAETLGQLTPDAGVERLLKRLARP
jgi:glycosyltransferase involved in cell wall biosynthesis